MQDNLPRTCGTVRFPANVPPPRDPYFLEIRWHPPTGLWTEERVSQSGGLHARFI